MAVNGVRDQDRLDGASNFIVWKARILSVLDRVKDHVVPHIAEKDTTNEMWEALNKLYQHTSV